MSKVGPRPRCATRSNKPWNSTRRRGNSHSQSMKSSSTIDLYRKHYNDIRFERAGLFKAIKETYNCNDALYPGSFIHITPSFFFPHVVYVDQSPIAIEFFADTPSVLQYISRNKRYKRSPYVRFIAQDYSTTLPLAEGQFDRLISLYASSISRTCKSISRLAEFW